MIHDKLLIMKSATLSTLETLEESARTVVVSMNPKSGATDSKSVVDELVAELESNDLDVRLLTDIEKVKSTVAELANGGLRAVVAAGGDGTVSLLANCLPAQTPLAILPLGTENLLAKYLGLTADPKLIANSIVEGKTVRLDAGRANGQLFLVMASCGFDAEVVHRLHSKRKGHINHWSYAKPIVKAIQKYRYPKIHLRFEDDLERKRSKVSGAWAFIFNVPRYAMNLPISQDANPVDGELDYCTFKGGNLFRGLLYLGAVMLRQHHRWRHSKIGRFKKVSIESDGEVPYQLDGDPGGVLPVEIEVVPQFLRVLVPASGH